jgi:hypothetical protein
MNKELAKEVFDLLETEFKFESSSPAFELAYQARIAIDRIRFVIRQTESLLSQSAPGREAGLQLLDALDRLQSAESHFQRLFRKPVLPGQAVSSEMNIDHKRPLTVERLEVKHA